MNKVKGSVKRRPLKYGSVYTPKPLAMFVAQLLKRIGGRHLRVVLDPACGEGALLSAMKSVSPQSRLVGVDCDKEAIAKVSAMCETYLDDFILPTQQGRLSSAEYWKCQFLRKKVEGVIANPPWSSDRVYSAADLMKSGFELAHGQYDSYVLFVELALKVLPEGAYYAFIIPDSFFAIQNETLRRWLIENTEVRVVARLGEKMFPGVFRATTVLTGRKSKPADNSQTICFRLDTKNREKCLAGEARLIDCFDANSHKVQQNRFLSNPRVNIDVDTHECEFALIAKLKQFAHGFSDALVFGRGVEVSKSGSVTSCRQCGVVRGCRRGEIGKIWECARCHSKNVVDVESLHVIVSASEKVGWRRIFVGDSLHRYRLSRVRYIQTGVNGVDYKTEDLFVGRKLLLRKTGLGIYAAIDESNALTNQTVYILRLKDEKAQTDVLYYYLGILNSRVVFYYYAKLFGENEWKSHPYITKEIVFSLPTPAYSKDVGLAAKIASVAKQLMGNYSLTLDLELEDLVMNLFGLTSDERMLIVDQMRALPDLGALKEMKALNV